MLAAVLSKPKSFILEDVVLPAFSDDEIRIQVQGCGICSSSIPVWQGREWFSYPLEPGSPGHEGWGVVDAVGDNVKGVRAGDHVAFLSFHSYAEFDLAKHGSFVKLPEQLWDQPFPGEPLGCAINILNRSDIEAGDTVAIIGAGFLGALLCQLVKNSGAKVIAISRRAFALDMAQRYGADEIIPLTNKKVVADTLREITGKQGCNRVIEATGKQEALDVATEIVAEGGKLIVAGYHQDGLRQVNMQQWNWKGIDVINAHERDVSKYLSGMQQAVQSVLQGIIKPGQLYTDILPLQQIEKGFELTDARPDGFMKALVTI